MPVFSLVIKTSKKEHMFLKQVLCIYYLLRFEKDTTNVRDLIDLDNEINIMIPAYALKLGFKIHSLTLEFKR